MVPAIRAVRVQHVQESGVDHPNNRQSASGRKPPLKIVDFGLIESPLLGKAEFHLGRLRLDRNRCNNRLVSDR